MSNKTWRLTEHSYPLADTGEYCGYWEITNGKISIMTEGNDDDYDESLVPIIHALNRSNCVFYTDESYKYELDFLKERVRELESRKTIIPERVEEIANKILMKEEAEMGMDYVRRCVFKPLDEFTRTVIKELKKQ